MLLSPHCACCLRVTTNQHAAGFTQACPSTETPEHKIHPRCGSVHAAPRIALLVLTREVTRGTSLFLAGKIRAEHPDALLTNFQQSFQTHP